MGHVPGTCYCEIHAQARSARMIGRTVQVRGASWKRATTPIVIRPANVLGVSCTARPACRSRSGTAVAGSDVRRTEWRTATARDAVTLAMK